MCGSGWPATGPTCCPHPTARRHGGNSLAQMVHFFALMLWVAGVLAFIAGLPQLGVAIFVVIVVNGVFAFVQETRAERAAERLRDLLPRRVMVIRSGVRHEIDSTDLVVDDLVALSSGDRVSADLRVVEAHALTMDTSLLTGESAAVPASDGDALLAGTFVVEGEAEAVVEAAGGRTRLAAIAELTQAGERPRSPLAHELDRVVRVVALIAVGVGVAFFGIATAVGTPASDGFLFAIGVTVALVPEGLLPTVTLSLAMGAQRMAGRHALIRRLESVETLGSTTFICTDKTGTLTCNEMAVIQVWTPDGSFDISGSGYDPTMPLDLGSDLPQSMLRISRARLALLVGAGRSTRWFVGGPGRPDGGSDRRTRPAARRRRRTPPRRSFGVSRSIHAAGGRLSSRATRCSSRAPPTRYCPAASTPAMRRPGPSRRWPTAGLRVLAVATRPAAAIAADATADIAERELELLGLLGLEDPPRPHAANAVAACRRAGIRVAMITGDHPATARAIATEVGLLGPDRMVLEGKDLPADEQLLGALFDREGVVAATGRARGQAADRPRPASTRSRRRHDR